MRNTTRNKKRSYDLTGRGLKDAAQDMFKKKSDPHKYRDKPYVNVGEAEFRPWPADAQDIRENLIDNGIIALSATERIHDAAPPTHMEHIVDRVTLKLKTGKFIWAGDISFCISNHDMWFFIVEREQTDILTDLLIDGFIGWKDPSGSHLLMSWIKDRQWFLATFECVQVQTKDPDILMKLPNAVAVSAFVTGTATISDTMEYLINTGFYDETNSEKTSPETALELANRSLAVFKLVAWMLETNDSGFTREKAVNRGARRTPLPSYHTAVPDGYVTAVEALRVRREAAEPKGGTHASPVPHDRRGTMVKLKSGKTFWRRPAKVLGGAEKAIELGKPVRGHYEVRT